MARYKERLFRSHGLIEAGSIRLKAYTIAFEEAAEIDTGPIFDHAAAALLESRLPWLRHRGLGYVLYHAGEDGCWLLTRLWLQGDIVAGLVAADWGRGFAEVPVPAVECVWEAVVTDHERHAWVAHMMAAKDDPKAAYLSDFLPDGRY